MGNSRTYNSKLGAATTRPRRNTSRENPPVPHRVNAKAKARSEKEALTSLLGPGEHLETNGNTITISPALAAECRGDGGKEVRIAGMFGAQILANTPSPTADETVTLTVYPLSALARMLAVVRRLEPNVTAADAVRAWANRSADDVHEDAEWVLPLVAMARRARDGRLSMEKRGRATK